MASGKGLHTDYNTRTHKHTHTHIDAREDTHVHTHTIHVDCSKLHIHLCLHTNAHKYTHTHILPQMWNSGLREGITHTNRTGQGLMGKLGETTESSQHGKMVRRKKGREMGRRQKVEKKMHRNPLKTKSVLSYYHY